MYHSESQDRRILVLLEFQPVMWVDGFKKTHVGDDEIPSHGFYKSLKAMFRLLQTISVF